MNYVVTEEQLRKLTENIDSSKNSTEGKGVDAILVGGLDDENTGYINLDKQISIFKQGFSGGNVKAFGYRTSPDTVLTYLKLYPKIPIFLYSAGCNLADELITSKLVDKNKLYLIEPFNRKGKLNSSVSKAIDLGLNPKNIFVKKDNPGRGGGFSGASDSGAKNHSEALRTVPQKLNF
jgi:methionine salvage enolase-phosphatase E1